MTKTIPRSDSIHNWRSRVASLALALVFLTGLSSCSAWPAKAPEETTVGQPTIVVPGSSIEVVFAVDTAAFANEVLTALSTSPLSQGRTDEISARLLVEEPLSVEKFVDVLIPAKAAECVTTQVLGRCASTRAEQVLEKCSNPFRVFDCWKTVHVPIEIDCWKDVQQCTDPIAEHVEQQLQTVIEIDESLFPTSVWLNHKLWLTGLSLRAEGTLLAVAGSVRLELSADIRKGALGASMTIKGALTCDLVTNLSVLLDTAVTATPSLDLSIADFSVGAEKICVPGAVELLDASFLDPSLFIQRQVLEPIIHDALVKELDKQLARGLGDSLELDDELTAAAHEIGKPILIGDNLWLAANVQQLELSQLVGRDADGRNELVLSIGVSARPELVYGTEPQVPSDPAPIPVVITDLKEPSFVVAAKAMVMLSDIEARLLELSKTFFQEDGKDLPFIISEAAVYQSGPNLTIALTVAQRDGGKVEGIVYLSARALLDIASGQLRLVGVAFDVDSRRVLAQVAASLLDGTIERLIEDEATFEYSGPLAELQSKFASLELTEGPLVIHGRLDSVQPGDVWIADGAVNVWAEATGALLADLKPAI